MLVLIECEDIAAAAQGDVRPARKAADQHILQVGLVEAVAEIPAHRRQHLRARPVQQHATVGVEKEHPGAEDALRQDRVGKADGLKHAHALVVEMHRARQMIGPRLALQHQGPHTAKAEQVGQRGADRAAADDHDVEFFGGGFILHGDISSPSRAAASTPPRRVSALRTAPTPQPE